MLWPSLRNGSLHRILLSGIPGDTTILVNWEPPLHGALMINTEGSVDAHGNAACGGLIRDHNGTFIRSGSPKEDWDLFQYLGLKGWP